MEGGVALYGHEEILKKLLLRNRWSEFGIISQDCSLGDPFQKLFANFDPSKNMAAIGGGGGGGGGRLFALYRNEEILKKSASLKALV